jgi:hypothetical protein
MREKEGSRWKERGRYGMDACACTRGGLNYTFHLSNAFPLRETISQFCYIQGELREQASPRVNDKEASMERKERRKEESAAGN